MSFDPYEIAPLLTVGIEVKKFYSEKNRKEMYLSIPLLVF